MCVGATDASVVVAVEMVGDVKAVGEEIASRVKLSIFGDVALNYYVGVILICSFGEVGRNLIYGDFETIESLIDLIVL